MSVRLPTRRSDWRLMARTSRLVLSVPGYAAFAALVAVLALTAFSAAQNLTYVNDLVLGGSFSLTDRVHFLLELYPFVGSFFGALDGALLLVVAALTGIDVALVAYHFREHGVSFREGGAGSIGVLLGVLGAGCAACGSAILVGLLSLLGISTSLLWLPLDGLEFALLAVVVLLLSIFWLADGMRGGMIAGCPVDP